MSILGNGEGVNTLALLARTAAAGASTGTGSPSQPTRLLQAWAGRQIPFAAAHSEPERLRPNSSR